MACKILAKNKKKNYSSFLLTIMNANRNDFCVAKTHFVNVLSFSKVFSWFFLCFLYFFLLKCSASQPLFFLSPESHLFLLCLSSYSHSIKTRECVSRSGGEITEDSAVAVKANVDKKTLPAQIAAFANNENTQTRREKKIDEEGKQKTEVYFQNVSTNE